MIERVDPLLGTVLDRRYRIDARIAAGGFGAIYRATHVGSGHEVALKVLHQRLATDRGVVARFRREGATLTRLRSPYTIAAYELGESADDQILYIVMELLRGVSLFERFRAHGPIPWRTMAKVARQVCHSLAEAHKLGIVHRDLKPTNIHLEPIGNDPDHVKVLDFGIAKILQDSSSFDASDLTNAGQMIGTLDYMSPEQMVGGQMTGQTDIYTLGIVMYEMISGTRPFGEAPTAAATLAAMLKGPPDSLATRRAVPASIDRIVMRCLEREPIDRYADVYELGAALDELLPPGEDNDATRVVIVGPDGQPVEGDRNSTTRIDVRPPAAMPTLRTQAAIGESTVLAGGAPPMPQRRGRPPTAPPPLPRPRPPTQPPPFAAPTIAFEPSDNGDEGPTLTRGRRPAPQPVAPMAGPQFPRPPTPGLFPPTVPPVRPPSTPGFGQPAGYDMERVSAREAAVRRAIWIVVLVMATVIGIAIATQIA